MNEIFETLAANNSRLFKIDYLNQHKDNEILKEVVRLALDPYTQFYIRKIPEYEQTYKMTFDLEWAINELKMLSSRTVTGNAAIDHLRYILSSLTSDDANVIERIIQKDLKCGVSEKTANTVWPNLIHEYPCMLCSPYDEKLVNKIKFPAFVQKKEDGMRVNAIVKDGKCEFRSRNGKLIDLLGNLEQEFIALAEGNAIVFDGELLVRRDGKILDRQTGNGIVNKANKGTISKEEAELVVATIWDIIPYKDFVDGKSNLPYSFRFDILKDMLIGSNKIQLVQTEVVSDIETATAIFNQMLKNGYEGIILKDMNAIWENKRSKLQIKFKGVFEIDLKVVEIQEGTGKYAGMIGSLLCESSDGIIKVSVGSGLTDDDRKLSKEFYLGKIVTINYNAKIVNKQGEHSLFLPIYVETRLDKDEANASFDIT